MNEAPNGDAVQPTSAQVVEVAGCWGTLLWSVDGKLYAILPRLDRDKILSVTGTRVVAPFLQDMTDALLVQCAYNGPSSCDFSDEPSLKTIEAGCSYGTLVWQVGQALWDAIPDDQRDALLEATEEVIHDFFHARIQRSLQSYAMRKLHGS